MGFCSIMVAAEKQQRLDETREVWYAQSVF